jgi:hypothetical protein
MHFVACLRRRSPFAKRGSGEPIRATHEARQVRTEAVARPPATPGARRTHEHTRVGWPL